MPEHRGATLFDNYYDQPNQGDDPRAPYVASRPRQPSGSHKDPYGYFNSSGVRRGEFTMSPRPQTHGTFPEGQQRVGGPYSAQKRSSNDEFDDNNSQKSEEKSSGVKKLISNFADLTSVNGVNFIKNCPHPLTKAAWSFLLFAAFAVMVLHLYSLIAQYLKYEKFSQVQLGFSTLTFPAITICNINPMRISLRDEVSDDLNTIIDKSDPVNVAGQLDDWDVTLEDYDNEWFEEDGLDAGFFRRKRNTADTDFQEQVFSENFLDDFTMDLNVTDIRADGGEASDLSSSQKMKVAFYEHYGIETPNTRRKIGHQIKDMLMSCSFGTKRCLQKSFKSSLSSKHGNCYTLTNTSYVSKRPGPDAGLEMVLYAESTEYVPGLSGGKGFQLVIHEPDTMAFPDDEGIALPPGQQSNIGLRMVQLSRKGSPYDPDCSSTTAFQQEFKVKYTRQTCQRVCEQNRVRATCKCYDEYKQEINSILKNAANLPPCRTAVQIDCMYGIEDVFEETSESCECYSPCSEVLYETTVSTRQWPTKEYANLLVSTICKKSNNTGDTCDYLKNFATDSENREEFAMVRIFFADLNYETVKEKPSYEDIQFISDIGGTIGLWIGLSVLGMCEMLHLIISIVSHICGCTRVNSDGN